MLLPDTNPIPAVLALFTGAPGIWEILLILMAMLLLFGKRLPEVGRSLGRGLVEFKKGLKGVQDEVHQIDVEATKRADDAAKAQQQAQQQQQALPNGGNESPIVESKTTEEQKTA